MRRSTAATTMTVLVLGLALAGAGPGAPAARAAEEFLPLAGAFDVVAGGPQDHVFLSGRDSGTVVVRDRYGEPVAVLEDLPGAAQMALSPDGASLFVALSGADAVAVVDTATLRETRRLPTGADTCPTGVVSTGDRVWFGFGCNRDLLTDRAGLGAIDLTQPDEPPVLTTFPDFSQAPPELAWTPARPDLLVSRGQELRVADISSGTPVFGARLSMSSARSSALTSDGRLVVVAAEQPAGHPAYRTDDLSRTGWFGGQPLRDPRPNSPGTRDVAVATGAGGLVATGSSGFDPPDIVVRDRAGSLRRAFHTDPCCTEGWRLVRNGLAFGTDGSRLYALTSRSSGSDQRLLVLDMAAAPGLDGPVTRLVPAGSTAVVTGSVAPLGRSNGSVVEVHAVRRGQTRYVRQRDAVADERGRLSLSFPMQDDVRVYTRIGRRASASVLLMVAPTVAGPVRRVVPLGSTTTLTGRSAPGTAVHLSFHRASDPFGVYPVRRTVTAGSDGTWRRPVLAREDFRVYASRTAGSPPQRTVLVQAR